jgi:hypothetical protein
LSCSAFADRDRRLVREAGQAPIPWWFVAGSAVVHLLLVVVVFFIARTPPRPQYGNRYTYSSQIEFVALVGSGVGLWA